MLQFLVTIQTMFTERIERLEERDKGATLVEYGLITGLIVAIAIAAMAILKTNVNTMFTKIGTTIGAAF